MSYKINIGKGDNGFTDFCGRRVKKTSDAILLMSKLDELSAMLGVIRAKCKNLDKDFYKIQKDISLICGNIAGYVDNKEIEKIITEIEKKIKENSDINLNKFVFFGDKLIPAEINLLRAKTRICEIFAWKIKKKVSAVYLNRLSDFLFITAIQFEKISR
ncbi:MAG: ATP:cob(I)alamin adenosyltransferase [Elusimicrobiota bacterium]